MSCLQLCYTWPRQVPLGRRACRLECMYRIKLKSGLNRTSRRQNCTKGSPKACLNQYSIHRQSLKVSLNRKGRSTSLLLNFVSSITSLQPLEIHRGLKAGWKCRSHCTNRTITQGLSAEKWVKRTVTSRVFLTIGKVWYTFVWDILTNVHKIQWNYAFCVMLSFNFILGLNSFSFVFGHGNVR